MIFYLIIWTIKLVHIHSAVLETSLRITDDLIFSDLRKGDDYFMKEKFSNKNKIRFDNSDKKKNIVKKRINKGLIDRTSYYEIGISTTVMTLLDSHSPHKTVLNIKTGNSYDYAYLLDEYYEESLNETKSNANYRVNNKDAADTDIISTIRKMLDLQSKKCSKEDIGLKAIKCTLLDYCNRKQSIYVVVSRLWRIIRTWFFIYIALAIPLWCTRGLCCCCLFCKFFKPHKTIEEAKRYFLMNPPGLLKTKKDDEVLYEPTKSERDKYEEFEHLIRTI